MIKRRNR